MFTPPRIYLEQQQSLETIIISSALEKLELLLKMDFFLFNAEKFSLAGNPKQVNIELRPSEKKTWLGSCSTIFDYAKLVRFLLSELKMLDRRSINRFCSVLGIR